MRLDDILDEIGGFGRYQKWIFFLTCLPNLLAGFFMLNPVFLLGVPDHRCAIPGYENDTYEVQSPYHIAQRKKFIPHSPDDSCKVYEYLPANSTSTHNRSDISYENSTEFPRQEVKCSKWVYDKSVFRNTFTSEENLVCDKEIWVANAEMIFYGGMVVGSLASGIVADSYGRKPVMYVALLLMVASSIGLTWVHEYWLFCIVEFILGGSIVATFMPAFVISIEMTSANKRIWPGVISNFPYVLGLVLLSAIAYGLREWRKIQLYTSIPGVIFIFYWWLVPESPRWLLTKGRLREAESILRTAARWNGTTFPNNLLRNEAKEEDVESNANFMQLFKSKILCLRSFLIFFNWLVVSLVYFGLALNSENLNGNLYLNFALSGIVEIPAYFLVIFLVDRFGRRRLFCFLMIICGLSCLSTIFSIKYKPEGTVTIVLAMFGRLCVTGAFSVAYIHSAEIFPTVVRNAGMGAASLFARAGTMAAPYIVNIGKTLGGTTGKAIPLLLFGGMALLSGLTSLLLPETLKKHLPETVSDGERLGRSGAFYFARTLRHHREGVTWDQAEQHRSETDHLLSTERSSYSTERELVLSNGKCKHS